MAHGRLPVELVWLWVRKGQTEDFVGPCEMCGQALCRQQVRGNDAGRWRHVNIGERIWQGL